MAKQLVFLCLLFAIATANLTPRSLVDEAKAQLEELRSIVKGDIYVAHNNLNSLKVNFIQFADDAYKTGLVELQQEAETIHSQLQTIKDLGHAAGKDISSCLNVREEYLQRLLGRFIEVIVGCTKGLISEAESLVKNGLYIIDININKVHALEQQLERCGENILCISPLITEIQLSKIRLPQNIKTEVQATQSLLNTLKVSVQSCLNENIAEYTTQAGSILGDIAACVDRIIG